MDRTLECDFFFGDAEDETIVRFDATQLRGFRGMLHTTRPIAKGYRWTHGVRQVLSRRYSHYLITGQIDYLLNWLIIVYCFLTRRKVYCWSHGVGRHELHSRLGAMIYSAFFRSMEGVFLYNTTRAEVLLSLGVKADRIHTIYNSLDTEAHTRIYESLHPSDVYQQHFDNNLPTVIYIGRIQQRKKLDLLVKAIASLNAVSPQANLVIVGDPADNHDICALIEQCGIGKNVWMYGACYDETKNAQLIYDAAVCVCPAAVGLTAIHSLSFGTPVVTNDDFEHQMPEFETIEAGQTGSFYSKDDVSSLAKHISFWLHRTPEERAATRLTARQTILKHWSVDYQIRLLKQFFPSRNDS